MPIIALFGAAAFAISGNAQQLLLNASAEAELSGWIQDLSASSSGHHDILRAVTEQSQVGPTVRPAEGSRFFSFAGNDMRLMANSETSDFGILSQEGRSGLSNPCLVLTGKFQTTDNDFGEAFIFILNDTDEIIALAFSKFGEPQYREHQWHPFEVTVSVPAAAAKWRVELRGTVVDGVRANVFFDDLHFEGGPATRILSAKQRPDAQLVDIEYDLIARESNTHTVSLHISDNNGKTYSVPANALTGDVGSNITPGTGKRLTWNAGIDWPGMFSRQIRFRLEVEKDNTSSIRGVVYRADGTVLAGAKVCVFPYGIETHTEDDGEFLLQDVPPTQIGVGLTVYQEDEKLIGATTVRPLIQGRLTDIGRFTVRGVPEKLLGVYSFDQPNAPLNESGGNGFTGKMKGAELNSIYLEDQGFEKGAVSFDGDSRIIVPIDINVTNVPRLTMGAWVKTADLNSDIRMFLGHDNGESDRAIGLHTEGIEGFGYSMYLGDSGVKGGLPPVSKDRWTFVVVAYDEDKSSASIFIDIDAESREDLPYCSFATTAMNAGFNEVSIGSVSPNDNEDGWVGLIDNPFFIAEALKYEQVMWIRNYGLAGVLTVIDQIQEPLEVTSVSVPGTANLFASGLSEVPGLPGGGGTLPPFLDVSNLISHEISVFCAGGKTSNWENIRYVPPKGLTGSTNIDSFGSISGLKANRRGFLGAVFLGETLPAEPPAILSYSDGEGVATEELLRPELGQSFLVGDGFLINGERQRYVVPTGAQSLYFGILDGAGFAGKPGQYGDNSGSFEIELIVKD